MFKHTRFATMLVVFLLATFASTGSAFAQTTGCDTSGSVSGTATPSVGTVGTTINFNATGFTAGEDVSFWFTLPNGIVLGTAAPVPGGVNSDGTIGPLPLDIDDSFVNLATGRWAITFQGASSNHQAIIYFCVLTVPDATAIAQPTSTSVPPTAVPPTATTEATAVATAAATDTSVPVPATAEATGTSAPVATAVPPTAEIPPTVAPVEATPTSEALPLPTVVTPGMPTTGGSDGSTFFGVLAIIAVAFSALSLGWLARRSAPR
jgi:hypothetical protein